MGGGKCEDDDDDDDDGKKMSGKATKGERELSYPRFRQVVKGTCCLSCDGIKRKAHHVLSS